MRQLLALSILLLGVSWAAAQDTSTQTNPTPSSPTQTTPSQAMPSQAASGQATPVASGETSVKGCLSGASGSYTLTDDNGTAYQLTGDTSKLAEHVGHEIKVTGTSAAAAPASSSAAPASADGSTPATPASSASQQTLQVSSVKHISKTCQSAGAAH